MKPTDLVAKIRLASVEPARTDERDRFLSFSARLPTAEDRTWWLELSDQHADWIDRVTICYADTDVELSEDDDLSEEDVFDIVIEKAIRVDSLNIFLSEFVGVVIANCERTFSRVRVAEMTKRERFETCGARIQEWSDEVVEGQFRPKESLRDPRKFVRDYSGRAYVVDDVRHWLLCSAPKECGQSFRSWAQIATRRLLSALVNHVSADGDVPFYHLDGPPPLQFQVVDEHLNGLFEEVTKAASWIYLDGSDADTRHFFFTSELAGHYQAKHLHESIGRALESAVVLYKAHARSAGRETLKAIADLRKNVVDETKAIAQKAQDLSSSLWRDLAVASVPFLIRFLPGGVNLAGSDALTFLAVLAIAFLIFSFSMQVWLNAKYFEQQKASHAIWLQLLGRYLSKQDLEDFSDKPIKASLSAYVRARAFVGCVYAVLCLLLMCFALNNSVETESIFDCLVEKVVCLLGTLF